MAKERLYKLSKVKVLNTPGLRFTEGKTYKGSQIEKCFMGYFELVGIEDDGADEVESIEAEEEKVYTPKELHHMKKDEQEVIMSMMGLDPSECRNEDERVAAILEAQS